MAVTSTYALNFIQNIDLSQGPTSSAVDATSLTNGFAAVGDHVGHTDMDVFGINAANNSVHTGGSNVTIGTNGSIDQLSNGNLVIVTQDADSVRYTIQTTAGATVVAEVDIADTPSSNADVAALAGGGFVIVNQDNFSATDNDIDVSILNNAGGFVTLFSIDSSGANDTNASVTALDGGGFAVAWQRTVGFETEIWYSVYNAVGGVVMAATQLDTFGTVNQNPSVTALNGGGFAIAYEDNGWGTGTTDITLARFDSAGNFVTWNNVGNSTGSNDANPMVTRLGNGLLMVGYGDNTFADTDTIVKLVDPNTGAVLATRNVTGGEGLADDADFVSMAGFGDGHIAVLHSNLTDGDADGEELQGHRTSDSDAAGDTITGDNFIDIMNGNGGDDTLFGGFNNDVLNGGTGDDWLDGGAGADTMTGGANNDTYIVSSLFDTVNEAVGGGTDVVRTTLASYTLGANVEQVVFTGAGAFTGTGNALNNKFTGGAGADRFIDTFGGSDSFVGLGGSDTVDYSGSAVGATVNLVTGVHAGAALGDTFSSIEKFQGSNTATDRFTGSASANTFFGNGGVDHLIGNGGRDIMDGGAGNDEINGGALNDTMTGGIGSDDFNYSALSDSGLTSSTRDKIVDFVHLADDIDVSAIDARAGFAGNNAFVFIGAGAFAAEGQIRATQSGANTIVEFNTAGAGGAEMSLQLNNFVAATLTAADFIL